MLCVAESNEATFGECRLLLGGDPLLGLMALTRLLLDFFHKLWSGGGRLVILLLSILSLRINSIFKIIVLIRLMLFSNESELQLVAVIQNDPQLTELRSLSFIDELRVRLVEVDMLLFLLQF